MKVAEAPLADVRANGVGVTTEFEYTISAKAFKMLTADIYPNPVRAVIREICCNAHDAHIEAGNPDKFSVHLPTPLEPWFSVRDQGVGLSDDDMRKVYTNFFKSTKTDSNDFTGAFGLGSKSPFAIDGTTNFTVKTWYDGQMTTYSCYLNERGLPVITSLHKPFPTDEPNGLEVQVDVLENDFSDFENQAVNVLQYFNPVPEINVPSVTDRITEAREELHTDDAFIGEGYAVKSGYDPLVVIMGNVSYKYDASYNETAYKLSGYITVPMGSLEIDPGRENILQNDSNRKVISDVFKVISDEVAQKMYAEIDELPTAWDRYLRSRQLIKVAGEFGVDLNKYRIKSNGCGKFTQHYEQWDKCKTTKGDSALDLVGTEIYLIKPRFNARIRAYVRSNYKKRVSLLTVEQAARLNLPSSALKDLDSLPKVSYNRSGGGSRGPKRTDMDIKRMQKSGYSQTDATVPIESDEERIYVRIHRDDILDSSSWIVAKAYTVFGLDNIYGINNQTANRPCFNSEEGGWIKLNDYIERELEAYDPEDHTQYVMGYQSSRFLEKIDFLDEMFDSIDDPEFQELMTLAEDATDTSGYSELCEHFDIDEKDGTIVKLDSRVTALKKKYMLLDEYSSYNARNLDGYKDHYVQYINMIHGAESDSGNEE